MIRLLVLDFDGVIADSARECFLVASAAYLSIEPGSPLRDRLPRAAPPLPTPSAKDDPAFRRFLEAMPLGNRAEDFGVALHALERNVPLPDQAAHDHLRERLGTAWLQRFHRRFYEIRARIQETDPRGWLELVPLYPGISRRLHALSGSVALALATARDRRSVRLILDSHGLGGLFPAERLLDKETGVSKRTHLRTILERTGIPAPDVLFIDDKVSHLQTGLALGVRPALATWGYNGPREYRLADRLGIPRLDLDALDPYHLRSGVGG